MDDYIYPVIVVEDEKLKQRTKALRLSVYTQTAKMLLTPSGSSRPPLYLPIYPCLS